MKNVVISIKDFNSKIVSVVESVGVKSLNYKISKGFGKLFIISFNDGSILEVIYNKHHGHIFKYGDLIISKRVNGLMYNESNKIISYILESIKD